LILILLLVQLNFVKRFEAGVGLEEYPSLEEVGKGLCELVLGKDGGGHAENLIELFERSLLGFAIE
jgi:hypothetical protein